MDASYVLIFALVGSAGSSQSAMLMYNEATCKIAKVQLLEDFKGLDTKGDARARPMVSCLPRSPAATGLPPKLPEGIR
jgi:hypothetical protein